MANDDSATTQEDTAVNIDVAANDSDVDGNLDPGSAGVVTEAASGTLTNNGDGTFTYDPDADYNGGDSFVYQICDTLSACDTATVTIAVDPVNDAPVALDDSVDTLEDTAVDVDATANDVDVDGNLDLASAVVTVGASDGTAVSNGDGSFTYTPNTGYVGPDGFDYEICDSGQDGDPATNADDLCDTATVTVTVGNVIFEKRIAASFDDAEERASGNILLSNGDLELVLDAGGNQTVGLRFTGVAVPQGATVSNAYVQFKTDETGSTATSLFFEGEAVDNASGFTNVNGNISSRVRTGATVGWSPAPWLTIGEAGPAQQSANIASVIQEIVNRGGWVSGNSLVLIITGTGLRTAESWNGDQDGAPLLHIEYNSTP